MALSSFRNHLAFVWEAMEMKPDCLLQLTYELTQGLVLGSSISCLPYS